MGHSLGRLATMRRAEPAMFLGVRHSKYWFGVSAPAGIRLPHAWHSHHLVIRPQFRRSCNPCFCGTGMPFLSEHQVHNLTRQPLVAGLPGSSAMPFASYRENGEQCFRFLSIEE